MYTRFQLFDKFNFFLLGSTYTIRFNLKNKVESLIDYLVYYPDSMEKFLKDLKKRK